LKKCWKHFLCQCTLIRILSWIVGFQLDLSNMETMWFLKQSPGVGLRDLHIKIRETQPNSKKSKRRTTHFKDDTPPKISTNLSKSFEHHQTLDASVDLQQKQWTKTKNQIFGRICQLGLRHEQIIQALNYIENSQLKTDHELFQDTLDSIIQDFINSLSQKKKKSSNLGKGYSQIFEIGKAICNICYDDYDDYEAVQIKNPLDCGHKFCEQYYIEYFSNKILTNVFKIFPFLIILTNLVIGSKMS